MYNGFFQPGQRDDNEGFVNNRLYRCRRLIFRLNNTEGLCSSFITIGPWPFLLYDPAQLAAIARSSPRCPVRTIEIPFSTVTNRPLFLQARFPRRREHRPRVLIVPDRLISSVLKQTVINYRPQYNGPKGRNSAAGCSLIRNSGSKSRSVAVPRETSTSSKLSPPA